MKNILVMSLFVMLATGAGAQITKVSLQASGLTCSMCSKAVKIALEEVSFVEKVQVDIKNQQYNMSFKAGSKVDFDALSKAVQDAGFSVAALKVTTTVNDVKLKKDKHLVIDAQNFHFLNGAEQTLKGSVTFSVVDKGFVTDKEFKKYAAMTKMPCVQTGRLEACCPSDDTIKGTRIYHVVI